jgi:hypothetical protein
MRDIFLKMELLKERKLRLEIELKEKEEELSALKKEISRSCISKFN